VVALVTQAQPFLAVWFSGAQVIQTSVWGPQTINFMPSSFQNIELKQM
jgi:hypothetical protein